MLGAPRNPRKPMPTRSRPSVRARCCLWSARGQSAVEQGVGWLPDGGSGWVCWLPGRCALAFTGASIRRWTLFPSKANLRLPRELLRAIETQAGPIGSMRLQYHRGTSLVSPWPARRSSRPSARAGRGSASSHAEHSFASRGQIPTTRQPATRVTAIIPLYGI